MIGYLPTQALAFLAVFFYATHATQAIAFEWKPGLKPANTGLHIAWRRAQDRSDWRNVVSTATLHYGHAIYTDEDEC